MEYRRIKPPKEVEWDNPILTASKQPHLGDIIFPTDTQGKNAQKTNKIFDKFYCDLRENNNQDIENLHNFIRNPQTHLFIIWGEVGIGKTFFVRKVLKDMKSEPDVIKNVHSGIIDLLRGGTRSSIEKSIYHQVCPIIEDYFSFYNTSTKNAAFCYAEERAKAKLGIDASEKEILFTANELLKKALTSLDDIDYAVFLLDVLEYNAGNPLFLVIDNIDRTLDDEQEYFLRIATRLLKNSKIKLIIPLRKSSQLLGDQFRGLHEFSWEEMELSPLILKEMLRIRFNYNTKGDSLAKFRIKDYEDSYRYKDIFHLLFTDEVGDKPGNLLKKLSYPNAREFLSLVRHVLFSKQIKRLHNFRKSEFIIASLMLSDISEADIYNTYILNLFENDEPGVYGNNLIRFRLLEYYNMQKNGAPNDIRFQKHFERLGYDLAKVKEVLALFVGKNILFSTSGLIPERISKSDTDKLGNFRITNSGEIYFSLLINSMWYYVSIKRSLKLPAAFRGYDPNGKHEYVKHTKLIEFIKSAEKQEENQLKKLEKKYGKFEFVLKMPSTLAKNALVPDNSSNESS